MSVMGMVNTHCHRSEIARFRINRFLNIEHFFLRAARISSLDVREWVCKVENARMELLSGLYLACVKLCSNYAVMGLNEKVILVGGVKTNFSAVEK